jgi:hypothetical protein
MGGRGKWLTLTEIALICATAAAASSNPPGDRKATSATAPGRDSDHDGLSDDLEVRRYHTDPHRRDTDHDGLKDGAEVRRYKTNPRKSDTDRDDLSDGAEVGRYRTDPRTRDTDRDRLFDGQEVRRYRTNPRVRDTDGDGWGDGVEIKEGTNPLDRRNRPGFPRDDNTGVPPGTVLAPYTGPSRITTPNTVIEGKTVGCIQVSAPGVVIRKSKVVCPGGGLNSGDSDYSGTPLLVEDVEIDCQNLGGTGLSEAHIVARRLNIHGCENGLSINQDVVLEDSYIHDLYNPSEAHADGIQLSFGHWTGSEYVCCALNVTIRHNTIYGMGADGSFGTSAIISNKSGDVNVLIENNLLAGGSYALYCDRGTGTNYRVLNNRFSRRFGPKVGFFGPATECGDETQAGNVIHETGQPLTLG